MGNAPCCGVDGSDRKYGKSECDVKLTQPIRRHDQSNFIFTYPNGEPWIDKIFLYPARGSWAQLSLPAS